MKTTKRITARHEDMTVSVVVEMFVPIEKYSLKDEYSKKDAKHRIERLVDALVRAVADGGRYYIQDVKVR